MNPHEQQAHIARWHAAGLDPDTRAARLALSILDRVAPAGWWAYWIGAWQRVRLGEWDVADCLVGVALAVDE